MIYSSNTQGGANFALTAAEHEEFKAGKPVVKVVADCKGQATITLQMKRPRSYQARFPYDDRPNFIEKYSMKGDHACCQLFNGPQCVAKGTSLRGNTIAMRNAYRNYRRGPAGNK